MDGHTCKVSEETSAVQQSESSEANKKLPFEAPTTVPVSSTTNSHERLLRMGHGLEMGRSVIIVDDAVKRILEGQFQLGVTKSSNRKGVLEMVKECAKAMPTLMAPAIHGVSVASVFDSRSTLIGCFCVCDVPS
jgi:hypothetical protein